MLLPIFGLFPSIKMPLIEDIKKDWGGVAAPEWLIICVSSKTLNFYYEDADMIN